MRPYLAIGRPDHLIWYFGNIMRCKKCHDMLLSVPLKSLRGKRVGVPRLSNCRNCGMVDTPFELAAWNRDRKDNLRRIRFLSQLARILGKSARESVEISIAKVLNA